MPRLRFGVFILAWYVLNHLPFAPIALPVRSSGRPLLFPLAADLAPHHRASPRSDARGWRGPLLLVSVVLGIACRVDPAPALAPACPKRGRASRRLPAVRWLLSHGLVPRTRKLDGPVVSVGLDPMAAPMNGVPSIDGYFQLYPLAYKHAFQRVQDDWLIRTWGSKFYASPPRTSARQVNSARAMCSRRWISGGETRDHSPRRDQRLSDPLLK